MMEFVFISDTHIKLSSSVRTGDYLEDIAKKLEFVVAYCNKNNCILLHGGDIFDTPSVPDTVKNRIFPVLRMLQTDMYCLSGNHSILYNSYEYKYKTSFQTCVEANLFWDLDDKTFDLGDVVITNELPIIQRGKPQIVIYHGFLGVPDGRWTFNYSDISSDVTDQLYICLGHDHLVYEPVRFGKNVKVFRPGSFARVTRDDNNLRNPKLLHIKVINGELKSKLVDIPCRDYNEVFKTKDFKISKVQQSLTYESIINQIKSVNQNKLSLKDALLQVTTEDVYNYIRTLLDDNKLVCQTINKNL